MRQTPLHDWHVAHGAQMVDFAGWHMPVAYTSLTQEHLATRQKAGIFDISHMGQIWVSGSQAFDFLQKTTSNDVSKLYDGRMQYSLLPAEDGGLIDDIIVSKLGERFFVVVNASNAEADLAHWQSQASGYQVELEARVGAGMIALQGPLAQTILSGLGVGDLDALKYYHLRHDKIGGHDVILSRSGYTGEDGFEICLEAADTAAVWGALFAAGKPLGLEPIGLGARNTLRLEMGYPLYGHEINRVTNPFEAGLSWVTSLAKGEFTGKVAMLKAKEAGLKRKLTAFELVDKGVARDGYAVLDAKGIKIGEVCSGVPSPSLGRSIGLAYVPLELSTPGCEFHVDMRGRALKAKAATLPFVKASVRKN